LLLCHVSPEVSYLNDAPRTGFCPDDKEE